VSDDECSQCSREDRVAGEDPQLGGCVSTRFRCSDEQADGGGQQVSADDPAHGKVEAGQAAVVVDSDRNVVANDELAVLSLFDPREDRLQRSGDRAARSAGGDEGVGAGRADHVGAEHVAVADEIAGFGGAGRGSSRQRRAVDGVELGDGVGIQPGGKSLFCDHGDGDLVR
jgi:hypothetical protein